MGESEGVEDGKHHCPTCCKVCTTRCAKKGHVEFCPIHKTLSHKPGKECVKCKKAREREEREERRRKEEERKKKKH